MSDWKPLTESLARAIREGGSGWCSEKAFARLCADRDNFRALVERLDQATIPCENDISSIGRIEPRSWNDLLKIVKEARRRLEESR